MNKVTRNLTILCCVSAIFMIIIIACGVNSVKAGRAEIAEKQFEKERLEAKIKWEADAPKREAEKERQQIENEKIKVKQENENRRRRIATKKRNRQAVVVEKQKTRTEEIEAQFSGWDGSHRKFTKLIKSLMNDPSSYKHVKTFYTITKTGGICVTTTFRGSNAFGGIVVNSKSAFYTADGNFIGWFE